MYSGVCAALWNHCEIEFMTLSSTPSLSQSNWRVCLMLCVIALTTASSSANASLLYDRLEISMYGRMGLAWDPSNGRYVSGSRMNLTGSAIGGRLEEGDYLEPTIKLHLLAPSTDTTAPYVDFVITPSMYSQNGLFNDILTTRLRSLESAALAVERGDHRALRCVRASSR